MPAPLSKDLRERIVAAVEGGASRQATALRFVVSPSSVIKLMQLWKRTGSVLPGQMGGWRDFALADHEEAVRSLIAAQPDLTLDELRDALAEQGIQVGRSSVRRFLIARGVTLKKSRSAPASRTARTLQPRAKTGAPSSQQ